MSPRGFAIDNTLLLMVDEERGASRVIVPPRLQITIAAHVRGAIVGEAHAVPAEVASVAAILTVLGERRLLRISDGATSARAATLARSDVVAVALERALIRRANTDALNAIAAII